MLVAGFYLRVAEAEFVNTGKQPKNRAYKLKVLTVYLRNEPGALFSLTKTLSAHEVKDIGFSVSEAQQFGICRIYFPFDSDLHDVVESLRGEGLPVKELTILGLDIESIFTLNNLLEKLSRSGINVDYCCIFPSEGAQKRIAAMKVDLESVRPILEELPGMAVQY